MAESFSSIYPRLRVERIPNGVDRAFADSSGTTTEAAPTNSRQGYAIVADDLSDARKVPPTVVAALVDAGVDLRLIGRSSPYSGANVQNLGRITDRRQLARVVGSCRGLLFLSSVDIFSMVMLEALCVGTPVLALPSANAVEALATVKAHPLSDEVALVKAVVAGRNWGRPCRG